jgi:hypothetical protein
MQEGKLQMKNNIDILRHLEMRSEGNVPKNGEPTAGFSSQCSSTPVGFGQGFLSKQ